MLFEPLREGLCWPIADGAALCQGRASVVDRALEAALDEITAVAPFRQMVTPGGFAMSVAMTNCGTVGWVTDRRGYRYEPCDPRTGLAWPTMPLSFYRLAVDAAAEVGYLRFQPDVCLINRYQPGARLSLHRDQDERSFAHPIVSVSLGIPAYFQFGGGARQDRVKRYRLCHGDVVVWGGASRLYYHGVLPLKEASHPRLGRIRIALTFRRAL